MKRSTPSIHSKKAATRKLHLNHETVRKLSILNESDLRQVAGGFSLDSQCIGDFCFEYMP